MFYNLDVLVPLFPDQNTFCRKTILPCSFIVKTHFVIEWPGLKLKQMKKKYFRNATSHFGCKR